MIPVVWMPLAALIVLAALGAMPLRGGAGQHAHAGPGALTVWQLRENAYQETEPEALEPEEITWPTTDTDQALAQGKHHIRSIDPLRHRLAMAVLECGATRSLLRVDACPARADFAAVGLRDFH